MIFDLLMMLLIVIVAFVLVKYKLDKKKKTDEDEDDVKDDKVYTIDRMIAYVKQRLDEITKINLYDIGLSEEELKRRK